VKRELTFSLTDKESMEGEAEESDEDVQGEDKPTVLWEKCIQQSIFVDLSEDESLHLSDLESSLALHLSQAESAASEASIHLSGSAELSDLDVTSSESSVISSQSERVAESENKSSILRVSTQRPNTMHDEPPVNQRYEDPGQNTSDEDQDDLPYDGELGSRYFKQTADSESNISSDGRETVQASPDVPILLACSKRDGDIAIEHLFSVKRDAEKPGVLSQENANTEQDNCEFAPSCPSPADIHQLLLRHFSKEELLQSGRLIEAETLPEVSLLESVDDTIISWAPTHNSTAINNNHSACDSHINSESFCSGGRVEKSKSASENSGLEEEAERKSDNITSAATDSITSGSECTDSKQGSGDASAADVAKQYDQVQRVTRSFSEMKYGQGQVHYPLPDFSKVAPKVKIPKAPSGPARPVPQSPSAIHRAQSSPGLLEVISRVLEDSVQPLEKPHVFKEEGKQTPTALVHHLQAEYDKLLTKYAEAENLIDQMRLGASAQPTTELMQYLDCDGDHQGNILVDEGSHLGFLAPQIPPSGSSLCLTSDIMTDNIVEKGDTTAQSNIKEATTASSSQPEEGPSDGERMTAELRDIIGHFMGKVEEFKLSVSNMSVSTAEQQMMLRSIMEAQDQLERKYISKKEEHRALVMQNYIGLSRNTGTFDPNRLVEGDIFRIGMHLEDIKEMIDKNVCEQISPPHSSSTPTPMKEMLHVRPSPLCLATPSPPSSLHEGPSAGFSTVGCKTWKEEEKEEEVEETSEVDRDDGLQQSSELMITDSLLRNTGHSSYHSRSSRASLEGLEIQTAEAGEERSSVLSEVVDHSDILAYLRGSSSSSRQRQWTPDSRSTPESVLSPVGECDLGECVSLAVEVSSSSYTPRDSSTNSLSEPPLNTSSVSQRIVSPETDSGFGSSYLNQSGSGPNVLTESVQSQNDDVSSSDSEGSCSNLQTAIHSVSLTGQRWASPHPSVQAQSSGAAVAVERWVETTTKEPSVRLQGSERTLTAQLRHHVSEPTLSTTMDKEGRGSPLYPCSCNRSSEVSKLKKDLMEGLVQLPHLTHKMDYLTSKYRLERRSKTRPQSHHRPASNSVWKPSSSRQNVSNLSSSQVRIEDWISSDMDPSKSKGTGSGDTAGSEVMLQFNSPPVGGRRRTSSVRSAHEFQYKHGASNKGSEGTGSVKTSGLEVCDSHAKQRPQKDIMESFYSKPRWSLLFSPSLQKPLLQVSYGSSSSLPASYKVREPQSTSHHEERSTQSDTALLPSNVYFQRTLSPVSAPSRTSSRTSRRRGSKEEEMSRTLDQAIEVARSMKRTTDRMARRLSADLAKAKLHRKIHNMQPQGGRKHQAIGAHHIYHILSPSDITLSVYTVTSKSMTVQWSGPTGASSYKITATPKNSQQQPVFAHFGGNTVMGSVNSLSPNTLYTMQLQAMDNAFNVLSSAETEETTAPEVPSIQQAYSKHSDSITVEFTEVSGATSYILRAQSVAGDYFSETPVRGSPGTVVQLQPYTVYRLSVMSVNSGGRSQPSNPIQASTVVMAPKLNTTSPDNGTIFVTWLPVEHAVLYTLCIIREGSSSRVKLNTTDTMVTFNDLEEGTTYCIKGTAWDSEGRAGDDLTVCQITRPLSPDVTHVQVTQDWSLGITVYWASVQGAESYMAWTTNGQNCTSTTNTYCYITHVECGQNHSVSVTAYNKAGPSSPSQPADYITCGYITQNHDITNDGDSDININDTTRNKGKGPDPCPPENIWVEEPMAGNCSVVWDAVPLVEYYMAFIKRDDGTEMLCNTTETTCPFFCMCGYTYLTTVFPCNMAGSSPNANVRNYTTIPCCPQDVTIKLVSTETLEIMWSPVKGAELYETTAAQTNDVIHCNDTAPVCALSDLKCNTAYSVTVTPCSDLRGCNHTCTPHTHTRDRYFKAPPCAPEILNITQTDNSTYRVLFTTPNTWNTNYTITATGRYDTHTCKARNSSCVLTQLPCGSVYDVMAVATTMVGRSLPGFSKPLETGPCCPAYVNVTQVTQAMTNVTWSPSTGARSYITSLKSSRGHAKCHTLDTHCLMGCITCGTNYSVNMDAISSTGHKSECKYHGFSSSDCCPTSVKLYRRANNSLRVYWRSLGPQNQNHIVELYGTGANYTCIAAAGSKYCDIEKDTCGDVYTVVVAPMGYNGIKVSFCQPRTYSVPCPGSDAGMGCNIVSVTSPSASTLNVVWSSYPGASVYMLDLRVVNTTNIAPVVVMQYAPSTQKLIQGLRPGTVYQVTLKVFQFYAMMCTDVEISMTVPATSQITFSKAISSSSIRFEWSSVIGADRYILFVEKFSFPAINYNQTFTTLGGQVDGLTPATTYNCYVFASNSAGNSAKSNTRTIMTLVQPPTGVTLVSTGKSTAQVTWNPVSKVLLYQVTVSDINNNPSNAPVIRNTSTTSMDISNLKPCSTYAIGVSSVNVFFVPGEAANVTHTTSTINPVTTMSVDYSCSSGMVTVTWDLVFGANTYRATAVDGTGASLNCTSASSSCQMTMLKCGEKYTVHITAISDNCESTSNTSALFETVPCAPANPVTLHDCSSNVIVFSWQPTNNTLYYVAMATDNTGKVTECRTQDNTCFFTNTDCGQFYKYNVYAISSECHSEVSQPEFVRTSPCLPTNVKTGAECHSDMLITTWESAAGALSYTVEAQGNTGETYNCTSSSNSCAVTGVPCGEHLSVWIVASNDNCSTEKVLGEVAQTVPCGPTSFSASVDCSQDSARVNWTMSIGAIFYSAVAEDTDGNLHSCNSMGTSCLIEGLRCGQNYTASIIATNLKCNSTASEEVSFMTAPCPPTNIEAFRDCDANHALIVWQNHQPTGLYTATIEDQSGAQLTCTSNTVSNCKITSLPCGKRYNVTVSYNDGNCPSTSTPISMDSAPCAPENVTASMACVTGKLTVGWDISVPAENYTTIISRGMGQPLHCNSTVKKCTTGGLLCGSSYVVTVFSVTGSCFSLPSMAVTIQALPCPPTNITATHTCAPDPVPVSWVASNSAKYYTAVAVSGRGHTSQCMTNSTSCSLSGLQCGEVYTIGVSGADDNCSGQPSDTVSLNTEPCPPTNVSSQLMCNTRSAQVYWDPSANAASYAVKATSNGQSILTCSSPSPNCTLSNLVCGEAYTIFVTSTDGTCVSNYGAPFSQHEVPCAPEDVSTSLSCGTNDLTVSWTAAAPIFSSLNYSATAVPLAGNISSISCQTVGANCSLSLQCGQTYNVSVKASTGSCSGPYSLPQTVQTAPCSPQRLTVVTDCGADSLLASWEASYGAISYMATATGPNGFSKTCSSSNLTCSVSSLQCASQYSVTVTAHDSRCSSSPSQTVISTGPCDPVNVTSKLHCGSDTATVSWEAAAGAVAYTVLAKDGGSQHYTSCRSYATSCQLSQLQCGNVYNLTVMAENATCNSTGSISTVLMTAPCSPSIQNSTLICGTNSSSLSWMPMANAIGYIVNATATNGHRAWCSSATATCTLTDLLCSETYMTTVTARGSQCDSAPGSTTNITTAPCPPVIMSQQYTCGTSTAVFSWTDPVGSLSFLAQYVNTFFVTLSFFLFPSSVPCAPENVSTTLVCLNHSVLVTWAGSPIAINYNVTVTGQDGHTQHCQTNTTSCQLPDIYCGETYGIMVSPYSETCAGHPSEVHSFRAGLCAPSNVTVSPACEDSTVFWSQVTGAERFIATATSNDGSTHTCSSNYSSCNFTDLNCGETYAVTVETVDRGCRSEPSSAVELRTALCPPTNLTGQVSCDTNVLTLMWNQSPVSGASYTLETVWMGGALSPSVNTTSNTSYTLSNLLCGQRYAFRIAAQDGNCRSSYSPPIEISTGPCQPHGLSVTFHCNNYSALLSWTPRDNAVDYYGCAQAGNGDMLYCHSTNPTCTFYSLSCATAYNFSVQASDGTCNSSFSDQLQSTAVPCPPDSVEVKPLPVQLENQVLRFTWTPHPCNETEYLLKSTGSLLGDNRTQFEISSYWTSVAYFEILLPCGSSYVATVGSRNAAGTSNSSAPLNGTTAPCSPSAVMYSGNSSFATISWDASVFATTYTVYDNSVVPKHQLCSTTGLSCSLSNISSTDLVITASNDAGESEKTRVSIVVTQDRRRRDLSSQMPENGEFVFVKKRK
ncbi:hypothetical protein L3Q82_021535, partial [Scortum barcoo]